MIEFFFSENWENPNYLQGCKSSEKWLLTKWKKPTRLYKNPPLIKSIKQQENKPTESDITENAGYSNRISRNVLYLLMHVLQWLHPMASRAIVQLQEAQLITNF